MKRLLYLWFLFFVNAFLCCLNTWYALRPGADWLMVLINSFVAGGSLVSAALMIYSLITERKASR